MNEQTTEEAKPVEWSTVFRGSNRHERRKAAKMARRAATEERMKARKAKQ